MGSNVQASRIFVHGFSTLPCVARVRLNRARVIQTGARGRSQSREEKVRACLLSRARLTRVLPTAAFIAIIPVIISQKVCRWEWGLAGQSNQKVITPTCFCCNKLSRPALTSNSFITITDSRLRLIVKNRNNEKKKTVKHIKQNFSIYNNIAKLIIMNF